MEYEKYLIKKGKLDLLSSLKSLDKKITNEKLKEYDLKNLSELKEYIIEYFEMCIDMAKDDIFTRIYFTKLLEHENSMLMSAYQQDIESLFVFVYENGNHTSYYIPTEIKKIIQKMLKEENSKESLDLQNSVDNAINKDLKDLLKTLVVKDLRHIGDLFLINRLSNKPKKELISIIYQALTDEEKLSEVIERFVDKEFNLLKKLMKNKGTIQGNNISEEEYHFLYMLGIVFLFEGGNKVYISMSDDVYNTIQKINLNKFDKIIKENTKVYNLLKSMVELYGAVSYGELGDYYNLYYGKGEDLDIPNNSLYFCDRCDDIEMIDTDHNVYFVNSLLKTDEFESVLDDILKRKMEIERKPIKLEELLKYRDSNYYEDNHSKREFKKYLKQKNIPNELVEKIILMIDKMYKLENTFIYVTFDILQECGLEVTEENKQEILNYLTDIYNNTRVWINNGWTPIEMGKEDL